MKRLAVFLLALVVLSACAKTLEPSPEGWIMLDQGEFSLYAPSGWEHTREQGIDSTVGNFSGDGMVLRYDYGMYSGFLNTGTESEYDVAEVTINGLDAKIATPKTTGEGMTIVYVENTGSGNLFSMWGDDLDAEQEALAVEIFNTLQFKQ